MPIENFEQILKDIRENKIVSLNIWNADDDELRQLSKAIVINKSLKEINISECNVDESEDNPTLPALINSLKNHRQLTALCLNSCPISASCS